MTLRHAGATLCTTTERSTRRVDWLRDPQVLPLADPLYPCVTKSHLTGRRTFDIVPYMMIRITRSNPYIKCAPATRFTIDPAAVADLAKDYGIVLPVCIQTRKLRKYSGAYLGIHKRPAGSRTSSFGRNAHIIKLRASMNPQEAAKTIAHELRHAMQCEQWHSFCFAEFVRVYNEDLANLRCMSTKSGRVSWAAYQRYTTQRHEADAIAHEGDGIIFQLTGPLTQGKVAV